MKVIRGFFSGIIGLILFVAIFGLTFSFIIKGIIKNDILSGVVKERIITEYTKKVDPDIKETIEEILNQKEISDLAEDVIDEYIKYSKNKDHKVNKKLVDDIIEFCVKNKDLISKISNEEITEEKLRSQETYDNLTKSINEGFPEVENQIGDVGETVVEIYGIVVSDTTRLIVIGIIIGLILLLMLINWSLIKWMSTVGVSLIINGTLFSSIYVVIMIFKDKILNSLDFEVNLNPTTIIIIGASEIVIGIILLIVKAILSKNNTNEMTY